MKKKLLCIYCALFCLYVSEHIVRNSTDVINTIFNLVLFAAGVFTFTGFLCCDEHDD